MSGGFSVVIIPFLNLFILIVLGVLIISQDFPVEVPQFRVQNATSAFTAPGCGWLPGSLDFTLVIS